MLLYTVAPSGESWTIYHQHCSITAS